MGESIEIALVKSATWGQRGERVGWYYRLNMSEMSSTSVSAAAIFSAEESCGRLPKRKDIVDSVGACYSTSYIDGESCYLLCDSFDMGRTMFGLCGEVELYVSPIKKMSWRESRPLELHDSALEMVNLSSSCEYSASTEIPNRKLE